MASCIICNNHIKFGDNYTKLSDGKCCSRCWSKAGLSTSGISYSSDFVRHSIERWKYIELAELHLKEAYNQQILEKQLQKNGFNDYDYCYTTTLNDEKYGYKVLNNTLYQIEDEFNYIKRHNLLETINTISDLELLSIKELNFLEIHFDNIQYFAKEGAVQYSTQISGGGGGGSSISGAIVGGLLAGGAGAIIGSRRATNPIVSSTTKHDDSITLLSYFDGINYQNLSFKGHKMYDFLLEKIPEKDIRSVQLKSSMSQSNSFNEETTDFGERLEKLKKLYENGLIDEKEYREKKKQVLEQL